MRGAPRWVLRCHSKNEFTNFLADTLAADFATRTPAPVFAEALAMPPHHCVRCHNQKRFLPSRPHGLDCDPKQLVESIQLGSLLVTLEDRQLLTKHQVFQQKVFARTKAATAQAEKKPQQAQHGSNL